MLMNVQPTGMTVTVRQQFVKTLMGHMCVHANQDTSLWMNYGVKVGSINRWR